MQTQAQINTWIVDDTGFLKQGKYSPEFNDSTPVALACRTRALLRTRTCTSPSSDDDAELLIVDQQQGHD
jgi:hypothetical protein